MKWNLLDAIDAAEMAKVRFGLNNDESQKVLTPIEVQMLMLANIGRLSELQNQLIQVGHAEDEMYVTYIEHCREYDFRLKTQRLDSL